MLNVTPRTRNGRREKVATKGGWKQAGSKWGDKPTRKPVAHECHMTYQPDRGAVSRQNRRRRTLAYAPFSPYAGSKEEARADKKKDRDTQQSGGREKVHAGERGRGKGKEQRSRERNKGKPANEQGAHTEEGTRRAHGEHNTAPERGAPEDQGKSSTTHHDTRGTGTTHTAHTQRTPATHPAVGGQTGEGQRLTPSAPHHGGRHPPRGRLSATPTASNAGPQGRTLWGRCRAPTPAPTAPGTRRSRNPGCTLRRTGSRGRDSAWHQAPPTTVEDSPPRGRPSATPTASNAGPQGRTLWGRCWVHTPASTAPGTHGSRNPGCTLRKTSGRGRDSAWHQAPLTTVEGSPPRGRPSATPAASNAGPQGRTLWGRCWVHTPASTAAGTHGSRNPGCTLRRTSGRGRDSA